MGIPQYKPMKTAQYFHIPLRNGILQLRCADAYTGHHGTKGNAVCSLNGSLFDQHKHVFRREEQLASSDRSAKRKPVSGQNQPAAQSKPSEQSKPAETTPTPVYTSPKSQKKPELPDCGDYESYEDFMDDWDGYMPDDSDAEDYWEDW